MSVQCLPAELSQGRIPCNYWAKNLVLRFPSGYNHAYEYCKDPAEGINRSSGLLKAARARTGRCGSSWTPGPPPRVRPRPPISNRERERRALETPLLSRIVSQLEGRLLEDG